MSRLSRIKLGLCTSFLALGVAGFGNAQDAEEVLEIQAQDEVVTETDEETRLGAVITTGTRISSPDLTVNSQVITQEDIQKLGVSTVQELLESLPQNLSNVNSAASRFQTNGVEFGSDGNVTDLQLNSLGVSSANLRGAGAGNTLVLVDGRRLAGVAGLQNGIVNLGGIPLNAIERVEIIYDGAASIYGSDALGGVINFITKKNYSGGSLNGRYEYGSNGGDRYNLGASYGKAWNKGSFSISGEYRSVESVTNAEAGWTTRVYCDRPEIPADVCDTRNGSVGGQPGLIVRNSFSPPDFTPVQTVYSLANGTDPLTATADDVIIVPQSGLRDFVPLGGGG